jgi:hypothetical protein
VCPACSPLSFDHPEIRHAFRNIGFYSPTDLLLLKMGKDSLVCHPYGLNDQFALLPPLEPLSGQSYLLSLEHQDLSLPAISRVGIHLLLSQI